MKMSKVIEKVDLGEIDIMSFVQFVWNGAISGARYESQYAYERYCMNGGSRYQLEDFINFDNPISN